MAMKMSVSQFKAEYTRVLREVAAEHKTVQITNHGKTVAIVEPCTAIAKSPGKFFGSLAGTASRVGDIVSPALAQGDWDANRKIRRRLSVKTPRA